MAVPTTFFADMVRETSLATGTGAIALAGALPGHRPFAGTVPVMTSFCYAIAGITQPDQWETGIGRMTAGGMLERMNVGASSAGGGAFTNFTPGLKSVALTVGAGWLNALNQPPQLADIAGLQGALDAKQASGSYAAAAHGHGLADVAGLQTALDGKQPLSTGHATDASFADTDLVTVRRGAAWVNIPAASLLRLGAGNDLRIATINPAVGVGERLSVKASATGAAIGGCSSNAAIETLGLWNDATSGNNKFVTFYSDAGGATRGSISFNRASGLTAYNTTSDRRAKDVLGPVEGAGAVIDALNPVTGRMKGARDARPMFVADEVEAVAPYAVTGAAGAVDEAGAPIFQQVDVSTLIPLMIAEMQALRARVAALESAFGESVRAKRRPSASSAASGGGA
jgi:hypothetical protein